MSAKPLYTLAYPALSPEVSQFVESFRRAHDPNATVVAAHFTMVFQQDRIDETVYLDHVRSVCTAAQPLRFVCRYAMLGSDDEVDKAYVFLVPDEGCSSLSLLHDALYRGPLAPHLRLDLPYLPHITIGASNDRAEAKRWCDDLNRQALAITGEVSALTVCTKQAGRIQNLATFGLGVAG